MSAAPLNPNVRSLDIATRDAAPAELEAAFAQAHIVPASGGDTLYAMD